MTMNQDISRKDNYNSHAKFLADIAVAVLNGNQAVLNVNGVKEIIALYLLIPYITPDKLLTPGDDYCIPNLDGEFCDGIQLKDLRNTLCHSFVTIEEDLNDGTNHGKCLIFDDRIMQNRNMHAKLGNHSSAYSINRDKVHRRLEELFQEVLSQ